MTPSIVILLGGLTVAIVLLIRATAAPRRRVQKPKSAAQLFRDAFVDDPDVVADDNVSFCIRSRDERYTVDATTIGREAREPIWDVRGPTLRVQGRTTLRCAPEGMISGLFDVMGIGDVKTGDDAFDKRAMVTGSDHDVVRALVCHPEVRQAIDSLMNGEPYLIGCEVDWQGALRVRFHRSGATPEMARAAFRLVSRLADALDAAADVAPMPPPREPVDVGSVAASSGSPLGVGGG